MDRSVRETPITVYTLTSFLEQVPLCALTNQYIFLKKILSYFRVPSVQVHMLIIISYDQHVVDDLTHRPSQGLPITYRAHYHPYLPYVIDKPLPARSRFTV